jgi:hypothetical protein
MPGNSPFGQVQGGTISLEARLIEDPGSLGGTPYYRWNFPELKPELRNISLLLISHNSWRSPAAANQAFGGNPHESYQFLVIEQSQGGRYKRVGVVTGDLYNRQKFSKSHRFENFIKKIIIIE